MLVRRLLLLLAVLIALTALASSIAPAPGPGPQPSVTAAPSTAGPEAAAQRAPGDVRDVRAALSAARDRPARLITARVGDRVTITVRSEEVDSVALGDLDVQPVEPGLPARFDFLAEAGSYPVVLLDAGRRIGTLEVR